MFIKGCHSSAGRWNPVKKRMDPSVRYSDDIRKLPADCNVRTAMAIMQEVYHH